MEFQVAEIVFWGSLAAALYAYAAYPLLIWVLSRLFPDTHAAAANSAENRGLDEWPRVSLVIAADRGGRVIIERLRNALAVDYPADCLEVIVGCEGDADLTGDLVQSLNDFRIRLIQLPKHCGLPAALNECVARASGDVIVLSDANTMLDRQAVRHLVRHFQNPRVGCVCGRRILIDPTTGRSADGVSTKFEEFLTRKESRFGALAGCSGGFCAIRKCLFQPLPANATIDDSVIDSQIRSPRHRLAYEARALATGEAPPSASRLFRGARIGGGAFEKLRRQYPLLNPFRGRVALAFWSQAMRRWFCPAFVALAIISNAYLSRDPFYLRILLVHELFYFAVFTGLWLAQGRRRPRFIRVRAAIRRLHAAF